MWIGVEWVQIGTALKGVGRGRRRRRSNHQPVRYVGDAQVDQGSHDNYDVKQVPAAAIRNDVAGYDDFVVGTDLALI